MAAVKQVTLTSRETPGKPQNRKSPSKPHSESKDEPGKPQQERRVLANYNLHKAVYKCCIQFDLASEHLRQLSFILIVYIGKQEMEVKWK